MSSCKEATTYHTVRRSRTSTALPSRRDRRSSPAPLRSLLYAPRLSPPHSPYPSIHIPTLPQPPPVHLPIHHRHRRHNETPAPRFSQLPSLPVRTLPISPPLLDRSRTSYFLADLPSASPPPTRGWSALQNPPAYPAARACDRPLEFRAQQAPISRLIPRISCVTDPPSTRLDARNAERTARLLPLIV